MISSRLLPEPDALEEVDDMGRGERKSCEIWRGRATFRSSSKEARSLPVALIW